MDMQFVVQGGVSPPNSFHSDRNVSLSSPSLSSNTIQSSGGLNSQAVYTGRSLGGFSDQAYSGRSLANNDGSEFVYSGQGFPSDRFQVLSVASGVSLDGNVNSTQVLSAQTQPTSSPTSIRPNQGGGPRVIIARGSDRQVVDIKPKMNVAAAPYVLNPSLQQQPGLSSSTPSYYAEMMPTAVNLQRNPPPPPSQQPPLPQPINLSPQGQLPFGVHYDPNAMANMQYTQAMYQMQAYHQQQGGMPYPFSSLQHQQQFMQHPHHLGGMSPLPPPPMYNTVNQPPIQFGGNTAALSDAFGRLSAVNTASSGNQDPSNSGATGYKTRSRRGGVKARQRAACRRAWEEEQMAKAGEGGGGVGDTADENQHNRHESREPKENTMEGSQLASNRSNVEGSRHHSEKSINNNNSDRPTGSARQHESKNDSSRSRDGPKSRGRKLYSSKKSNENEDDLDADLEDVLEITPTVQLNPTRPLLKVLAKECKPRPPWFCGYPFAGCSGPDAPTLTEELIAFSRFVSPSPPEFDQLSMLFNKCLGVFQILWPDCEFRLASVTAAGVVPPKGCPMQVYAVHTHNFELAINSSEQLSRSRRKSEKRFGSGRSTSEGGSGRPTGNGSSQPADGEYILENLLALPVSAVPKTSGTAGTRETASSVHDNAAPPEESLFLPFAPLLNSCIERILKSEGLNTEEARREVEKLIVSHLTSANLECELHTDARGCRVALAKDPEEGHQIAIRFGPRAVLSEKTAILLRRQIAHNYHARLALCATEALLRQNNLLDTDGTRPSLLSEEALAVLMLTVVRTRQMDRHTTKAATPTDIHQIPHAGGLLNSFLFYFGSPANFDPASHSADYIVGLREPAKKLHTDAKFSVCDPSDDPRVHVSVLTGAYHAPVEVPGSPTPPAGESSPKTPTVIPGELSHTPRNLASSTSDTRHLAAVLNYCYAAMEAHESSAPSKRKAQSVLSTIIGGEAYWGRVMELYEHVVEPWYGVVHHLRRILAKTLADDPTAQPH